MTLSKLIKEQCNCTLREFAKLHRFKYAALKSWSLPATSKAKRNPKRVNVVRLAAILRVYDEVIYKAIKR